MQTIRSVALTAAALAVLVISVPVYASNTDAGIESSARESYNFRTFLKDDDIKIQSKGGAVTLTGSVFEEFHKALAQQTVASLNGVESVDNRLELKGESAPGSDDRLVDARVKLELLSHRNLSATKTDIEVENGIVTLRGEATSQAQIDLATEYIRDVEGVKDVKNDMTVQKTNKTPAEKTMGEKAGDVSKEIGDMVSDVGESIDDASITALVKVTLLYHRSTSALKTTVETVDGTVQLSGTARTASEKDLTTKFVKDVHGVKIVVNNMAIEGAEAKAK
jgi:hyperosmotically inducible periplasmic protein